MGSPLASGGSHVTAQGTASRIVREPQAKPGEARRPAAGAVQAAELKPGQERKELEGVFVVKDGKAEFVPVATGVAGEKYFEVLSGVKEGDIILKLGEAEIKDNFDLVYEVSQKSIGDKVRLTVEREGEPLSLEVTFISLPPIEMPDRHGKK